MAAEFASAALEYAVVFGGTGDAVSVDTQVDAVNGGDVTKALGEARRADDRVHAPTVTEVKFRGFP